MMRLSGLKPLVRASWSALILNKGPKAKRQRSTSRRPDCLRNWEKWFTRQKVLPGSESALPNPE
jgi:hypothetical protein